MKYILVLAALLFSTQASAFGYGNTFNKFTTFSQSHAFSAAYARAYGGYGQGGGGGEGGNVAINTPRIASMAYAPPAYPTATCLRAYSGGGSGIGFGFSAGVTVVDHECRKFEGIRALVNLKRNGVLEGEIDGMILDITCETESIATTDKCVAHNAQREVAKNPQTASSEDEKKTVAEAESEEVDVVEPDKLVSLDWPWNWSK